MSEQQIQALEAQVRVAVDTAIKKVGMSGLLATSLFLSNESRKISKAA